MKWMQPNRYWTLSYFLLYVCWFGALEARDPWRCSIVQLELDRMIPFCEFFIIPYLLWFFYVGAGLFYLLRVLPSREWRRFALLFFGGLTVILMLNTVFYTGLHLRPRIDGDRNLCSWLVARLWERDTSTNVCPSIHVFITLVMNRALAGQSWMRAHPLCGRASDLLSCAIILSTLFLKQHSLIDVFCAFALYCVLYSLLYAAQPESAKRRVGQLQI